VKDANNNILGELSWNHVTDVLKMTRSVSAAIQKCRLSHSPSRWMMQCAFVAIRSPGALFLRSHCAALASAAPAKVFTNDDLVNAKGTVIVLPEPEADPAAGSGAETAPTASSAGPTDACRGRVLHLSGASFADAAFECPNRLM